MYYFWAGNEKKTQKWTWKVCYTPLCSTAFCKKPQKIIALHYYFYYNYKDLKKNLPNTPPEKHGTLLH